MEPRLSSTSPTPLVGRARELELLRVYLDSAAQGRGGLVLVTGEAGIGKSRLVAEAAAEAAGRGFQTLKGSCFEPDRALPYAPLLDLLRLCFAAQAPELLGAQLGATAPELVKLVPELAAAIPGLAPTPSLEPDGEKRRLFHALVQFVSGRMASAPVLLLIEDIHWSDDTSLEFLQSIGRHAAERPLLIVLTYRSDEVHSALARTLATLTRGPHTVELRLAPLTHSETDGMLRGIFGLDRPARADFLDAIHELTEGNPFFIEEVLKSLVAVGDIYDAGGIWDRRPLEELRIPLTVHDAVQRRAEHLSEAARAAIVPAAVAGRRFDFALLQALTGLDERALLEAIKEMIAAQLVVEESADRFAFRHALTRQAIYTGLLARERRALHLQVAEAIERTHAGTLDAYVADLAYHSTEAWAWPKALEFARRAGEQAVALNTPRVAVEQFTRAVEAATQLGETAPPEVYRSRGRAYETLGEFERARADLETVLARARAAHERRAEWQALIDIGYTWASRDYGRAGESFERALALARTLDDPLAVAHSLNRLGNWAMNLERVADGLRYHREALAIVEGLDDPHALAETLDLLGVASYISGDLMLSKTYYQRAIPLWEALNDRQGLSSSLAIAMQCAGNFDNDTLLPAVTSSAAAILEGERAVTIAREIGWRAGEAFALIMLGGILAMTGEYDRSMGAIRSGLAVAEEIEHRQWTTAAYCALGALHLDLLALPSARHELEAALRLAHELGSPLWVRISSSYLASAYILSGMVDRATAVLDAVQAADAPPQSHVQRLCWAARAEVHLVRGDPATALELVDTLIATAANMSPDAVITRLWQLRGDALAALGRVGEAEATLLAASRTARSHGTRPRLWRALVSLGRLYQAQGRRTLAAECFAEARSVVNELVAAVPDEELRATFLQHALSRIPQPRPPTANQAAKEAFRGLTAREREVAALVAQGKSNGAIADAIVVSERTVEAHVSHILAKLDLTSRAQIAAWAATHGLVPHA